MKNGYLCCDCAVGGRMDIVRLIALAFLVLWVSDSSAFTVQKTWQAGACVYVGEPESAPTSFSLCVGRRAVGGGTNPESEFSDCRFRGMSGTKASFGCWWAPGGVTVGSLLTPVTSCGANATLSGTTCTCAAGYGELNNACVPNNCPATGTQVGGYDTSYKAGTSAGISACVSGCGVKGSFSGAYGGNNFIYGPFYSTGQPCDGSSSSGSPTAQVPPVKCDPGMCPGTVNGANVCVACSSVTQTSATSSASAASSAASGASPSSSSESSSGSSTTTCAGGSCTTTEKKTVVKSDGSTSEQTSSKTQPQSDFCAENPKAAVCKADDKSKWGGACSGGFSCDGDAVQCAQAQAAWKLACAMEVDSNDPYKRVGDQVANGTLPDSDPTKTAMPGLGGDLSNSIDQTAHYLDACPGDIEVAVGDYGSFTVPMSKACPYFEWAGYIGVALALMAAAKIALGA